MIRLLRYDTISIIIILLFFFINNVHSQTIVNTEKLATLAEKGYTVGIEFNFDFEQGNSDVVELNGKSILGYENEKHSIKLLTGLKYLSEDKNELIYRNFIHLRYNYFFTPSIRSFSFYQLQRNNSLLLKRRQIFGTGLRKVFRISDSLKIDVGSGLMYEMETLNQTDIISDEKTDQTVYRMTNIISVVYQLKSYISLINALYFQPDVSDFDNFRMLDELSVLFAINKFLQLNISSVWRNDSQPPQNLKRNDISIQTGIVLTFHGKE